MNPTFLKYEPNLAPEHERKFEGIATIGIYNNQIILRYRVQKGKEGKGLFFSPFSQKLNEVWVPSHVIDSNYVVEEINAIIRKGMASSTLTVCGSHQGTQPASYSPVDDSTCPF